VTPSDKRWVNIAEGRASLEWGGEGIATRAAEISDSETYLSARAWYWVNGRFTASDAVAKALLALAKVSLKSDRSAVIVIYTSQPDARTRDARPLEAFAREMSGAVMAALRQANGE
jgi:EpsI family protein